MENGKRERMENGKEWKVEKENGKWKRRMEIVKGECKCKSSMENGKGEWKMEKENGN